MSSNEMDRRVMLGLAGVAGMAALAGMAKAGPINPPAGPVGSTSKPLGEVEPRTAINATNTPGDATAVFILPNGGSYYLTGDVSVPSGKIGIKAPGGALNLTIDLNGFKIQGSAGSGAGISRATGFGGSTLVVRNGVIAGMGGAGISGDGQNVLIEDVSISDCTGAGFDIQTETGRFVHCGAFRNGAQGFNVGTAAFLSCVAEFNTGYGFQSSNAAVLEGCVATFNIAGGFTAGNLRASNCFALVNTNGFLSTGSMTLSGCQVGGGTTGFSMSGTGGVAALDSCTALSVSGVGFSLLAAGSQATGCVARGCTGFGFQFGSQAMVQGCNATGNTGGGFSATGGFGTLIGCSAVANGTAAAPASGFVLGNLMRVESCTATSNIQHGFTVMSNCTLCGCVATSNGNSVAGNAGILVTGVRTSVDGCTATNNTIGVSVAASANIVTRCRAGGNTMNFSIVASNFVGASVTTAAGMAGANGWANFEF